MRQWGFAARFRGRNRMTGDQAAAWTSPSAAGVFAVNLSD
jgi:hypothetical protein